MKFRFLRFGVFLGPGFRVRDGGSGFGFFEVRGFGLGVRGLGFGVFEVRGFGLGVRGSGFLRFGVSGVSGSGYRVRRFTFLGFLFGVLRFEVRA